MAESLRARSLVVVWEEYQIHKPFVSVSRTGAPDAVWVKTVHWRASPPHPKMEPIGFHYFLGYRNDHGHNSTHGDAVKLIWASN